VPSSSSWFSFLPLVSAALCPVKVNQRTERVQMLLGTLGGMLVNQPARIEPWPIRCISSPRSPLKPAAMVVLCRRPWKWNPQVEADRHDRRWHVVRRPKFRDRAPPPPSEHQVSPGIRVLLDLPVPRSMRTVGRETLNPAPIGDPSS
jgi:hypothetical protein